MTLELYGIARKRAGAAEFTATATTLGEALVALSNAHPGLEGEVVRAGCLAPHWRASLGGGAFVEDPATPLPDLSRVVILSGLAGG